jgi:hypothetical protein
MSPGGATPKGSQGHPEGRRGAPDLGPIVVTWHQGQRRPIVFVWRGRRYRVERLLENWVVETGWWKDEGHVSRSFWRVRAEGRVFDLRYDRLTKIWTLERALN